MTTMRAVRVTPMQQQPRPRASILSSSPSPSPLVALRSRPIAVVRKTTPSRKETPSSSSTCVRAGPSTAAVAAARAASRVPVWLIPDISQLDPTAAAAAWAAAQEIPLPSLFARAGAEIGIAFLVAGLGVKLLGKLAVESMRV